VKVEQSEDIMTQIINVEQSEDIMNVEDEQTSRMAAEHISLFFNNRDAKARFPLPEFTAQVHKPSSRPVNSTEFTARELAPSTRVVETGLKTGVDKIELVFVRMTMMTKTQQLSSTK